MNYFFDCEYEESSNGLLLISIGIVAQDGREYYAESSDVRHSALNPWLKENVVPHLKGGSVRKPRGQIASDILNLIAADIKPQFWGYFVAHDWVLLCGLYGGLLNMPLILPGFAWDLKAELVRAGFNGAPACRREGPAHHALFDAKWNFAVWRELNRA